MVEKTVSWETTQQKQVNRPYLKQDFPSESMVQASRNMQLYLCTHTHTHSD